MTTTAWAHLPNAVQIDRILASLKAHPKKWGAAWTETQTAATTAAIAAAQTAAQTAARGPAWYTAWAAAWGPVMDAAQSAIAALVAWDDCAYMLDLPEDNLKELREAGNQPAILLSAAASVLRGRHD